MANLVYARAHDGLAKFISARAASRVLQEALASKRQTPDSVDAAVMGKLLRGRILSELEHTLPRSGLKRQLDALAATLPVKAVAAGGAAGASFQPTGRADSHGDALVAEPPQFRPEPRAPVSAPAPKASGAPAAATVTLPVPKARIAKAPSSPEPVSRMLSPPELEALVLAFAQLAEVRLVAAIRAGGKVIAQRGGGIDLAALSRLGPPALKLLRRSGALRSFYLAHSQGQFFMLPFGRDTIVVFGSPELNVGALFATLTTLKEEL